MPYMPNVTDKTEPFPANYMQIAREYARGKGGTDIMVSAPKRLNAWSMYQPAMWYTCIRRDGGSALVSVISGGSIAGTIPNADRSFCDDAQFLPLS